MLERDEHREHRRFRAPALAIVLLAMTLATAWSTVANAQSPSDQDDVEVADVANEVRITLDDGRSFRGVLVKRDRMKVVLRIAGINTEFDARRVTAVNRLKPFEEQYDYLKERIHKDDYEERYDFCEWIYRRDRLELAAQELESLIDDFPTYDPALTLYRTVALEIESRRNRETRPAANPIEANPQAPARGALLTEDQVNIIRVYEIDLDDPPRLLIGRETIEKMLNRYADHELMPRSEAGRRRFYFQPPDELLSTLFQLRARELYHEVRVLSDPESMQRFRSDVHRTWLINSCATTDCHGGAEAGDLFLFNRNPNEPRVAYTNFLILERTRLEGKPLLDFDRPEHSTLLQMGLPPGRAIPAHPAIEGWKPVFHDENDPLFRKSVEWIRSMYQPRPDYGIEYVPPALRDAPEPDPARPAAETPETEDATEPDR
ncbi:MAG: hypothetical protein ACF8PN_00450 [Phycisphaerales bacterium]